MMNTRPTTELERKQWEPEPLYTRLPAQILSYVFHPLFIPFYVALFIVYVHPSYFTGVSSFNKTRVILSIGVNTIGFPMITVLLLKGVGFIDSIFLRTQKDRIIPYIASGIFYFWIYFVLRGQPGYPPVLVAFILGVFLAASASLIVNIYNKISMHATGMGGLIGIFLVIMQSNTMLMTWPLALALVIAGMVCTARMLVSDHTSSEIYIGFFTGLLAQLAAALSMQ